MVVSDVFQGIDTSDPTLVAFALMAFLENRDAFTPEFVAEVEAQARSYMGSVAPTVAAAPTNPGWPSYTG